MRICPAKLLKTPTWRDIFFICVQYSSQLIASSYSSFCCPYRMRTNISTLYCICFPVCLRFFSVSISVSLPHPRPLQAAKANTYERLMEKVVRYSCAYFQFVVVAILCHSIFSAHISRLSAASPQSAQSPIFLFVVRCYRWVWRLLCLPC